MIRRKLFIYFCRCRCKGGWPFLDTYSSRFSSSSKQKVWFIQCLHERIGWKVFLAEWVQFVLTAPWIGPRPNPLLGRSKPRKRLHWTPEDDRARSNLLALPSLSLQILQCHCQCNVPESGTARYATILFFLLQFKQNFSTYIASVMCQIGTFSTFMLASPS